MLLAGWVWLREEQAPLVLTLVERKFIKSGVKLRTLIAAQDKPCPNKGKRFLILILFWEENLFHFCMCLHARHVLPAICNKPPVITHCSISVGGLSKATMGFLSWGRRLEREQVWFTRDNKVQTHCGYVRWVLNACRKRGCNEKGVSSHYCWWMDLKSTMMCVWG